MWRSAWCRRPESASRCRRRLTIVPAAGVAPSAELRRELDAYCREKIARYAIPREFEFRESLPTTLVGKVAYRVLEEEEQKK